MTNVAISLQDSVMLLGAAQSSVDAQALELLGLMPKTLPWQGNQLATAFVAPPAAGQSLPVRLVWLLEQLLLQSRAVEQQQVYLILPEQAGADDSTLNAFLQLLMQRLPPLLMSPGCRVFPYGSAGALMALNAATQYFQQFQQHSAQDNVPSETCGKISPQVWLVAVDSLAQDSVLNRYAALDSSAVVLSEGAIALCIAADSNGNSVLFHAADASPGATPEQDNAIGHLFLQLATQVTEPLKQLYLPDCGDEQQSSRWLMQYSSLHGAVDVDSQLVFPAYACGELGASGGLYRLWHLLSRLQRNEITGLTAQLEISARQYRALTLFSPAKPCSDYLVNKDVKAL